MINLIATMNKTRMPLLALALAFALCSISAPAAARAEGEGFDSPEAAVMAYLEGLRDGDLHRMISTFAIENYAENFNLEANLNMLRTYVMLGHNQVMPNSNEFVALMNIESRRRNVTLMIQNQYLSLCDLSFDRRQPQRMSEEAGIREFVDEFNKDLNEPKLYTIEIVKFILPETLNDMYLSERTQSRMAQRADILGADQIVSRVVAFTLDGDEYWLCLDVVRYGDKWFLESLGGSFGLLLNIPADDGGVLRKQ